MPKNVDFPIDELWTRVESQHNAQLRHTRPVWTIGRRMGWWSTRWTMMMLRMMVVMMMIMIMMVVIIIINTRPMPAYAAGLWGSSRYIYLYLFQKLVNKLLIHLRTHLSHRLGASQGSDDFLWQTDKQTLSFYIRKRWFFVTDKHHHTLALYIDHWWTIMESRQLLVIINLNKSRYLT